MSRCRHAYNVFLSYPVWESPNTIWYLKNNTFVLLSNGTGSVYGPQMAQDEMQNPKTAYWWNGYSLNGTAYGLP